MLPQSGRRGDDGTRQCPFAAADGVRRVISILKLLVLAYVGYAGLLFILQRRVLFPGTMRDSPRTDTSAPPGVTQIWLEASFGRTEAWFFPAEGVTHAPTVVFAHGNGELIEDWRSEMEMLARAGMNALLVEFPGYGHSQGKPSRATLRETFSLAFDWLVAQDDVDADRIVAHGRSMGGGVAGDLALSRPVSALVLQSTFSSTGAMARESFLPGFLVRDRFDNRRAVEEFSGPVLLMHGIRDDVISFSHAETLAAAREGLEITRLDCAHNDCTPLWPEVVEAVKVFLNAHLAAGVLKTPPDGTL